MTTKTVTQKLLDAYSQMLERVKHSLDDLEERTAPAIYNAIESARKTAEELGELTQDEAEKVSMYLKRDLQDAGKFLNETGKELADWLAFDWQLIEERTWEAFLSVADKTKLAWFEFEKQLELGTRYATGEITSAGTLYCIHCTQALNFYKVTHIPPCPKCHSKVFIRGNPGQ